MLFEKIKYLVDVRKGEMDRLIAPGSSGPSNPDNQFYKKYLNHHQIKFLYNELISLIRTTYHNIYLKEKEDEEKIISQHFTAEENLTSNLAERERLKNTQQSMSFGPQAHMKPSLKKNSANLTVINETKRDQSTGDSLDFTSLSSNDVSLKGFSGTGTIIEKK